MFNSQNFCHLFNLINNLLFFICGCVVLSQVHSHTEIISNVILSIHIILVSLVLTYYEVKNSNYIENKRILYFYYGLTYLWNGLLLFGLYDVGIAIGIISVVNGIFNFGIYIISDDTESNLVEQAKTDIV